MYMVYMCIVYIICPGSLCIWCICVLCIQYVQVHCVYGVYVYCAYNMSRFTVCMVYNCVYCVYNMSRFTVCMVYMCIVHTICPGSLCVWCTMDCHWVWVLCPVIFTWPSPCQDS